MTSSGTSTNAGQFFLLLSMVGAIAAVAFARDTHPVALLLLSGAVLAAGLVGFAVHRALAGFFGAEGPPPPVTGTVRDDLEREKALALRSIKELEFDHAMGKVAEADFTELRTRLRARALDVMEALERAPEPPAPPPSGPAPTAVTPVTSQICAACQTENDGDARFCKQCGGKLGA